MRQASTTSSRASVGSSAARSAWTQLKRRSDSDGMTTTAQTAPTFQTTADVIARFNEAFRSRDVAALAAAVHDDCLMVSARRHPTARRMSARTRASRSGPS